MPNYHRAFVPGGSFFFTVVVHRRRRLFDDARAVAILGSVFRRCAMRWPFTVNALVLLPDHLHAIWSLPSGDSEYRLGRGRTSQNYLPTLILNGADLWSAIESPLDTFTAYCETFLEGPIKDATGRLQAIRRSWRRSRHDFETSELKWDDLGTYYARDVFARVYVVLVKEAGAAVRLPGKYRGWIPKSMISSSVFEGLKRGDLIECRILKWDDERESFLLACEETV